MMERTIKQPNLQITINNQNNNNNIVDGVEDKKRIVTFKNTVIMKDNTQINSRKWDEDIENKKNGKFDLYEMKILLQSFVRETQKLNLQIQDLDQIINDQKYKSKLTTHKFWSNVCSVIPNRSLNSCFKHIKRTFNKFNHKGKWNTQETDLLIQLVKKYGKKWSKIGKQMQRSAENVRDRYRNISQKNYYKIQNKNWTLQQLIILLLQIQKQSKINFNILQIKQLLINAQQHNQINSQQKQIHKRKYNTKKFMFHNMKVILQYIKFKQIIKVNPLNIGWKQISMIIDNKSLSNCRQKFYSILKYIYNQDPQKQNKNLQLLNFIGDFFLHNQQINWQKWNDKAMCVGEGYGRWTILKNMVQNRSQKSTNEIYIQIKQKIINKIMNQQKKKYY